MQSLVQRRAPRRALVPLMTQLAMALLCLASAAALGQELIIAPHEDSLEETAIDRRIALERSLRDNPFAITPHRTSYLLPFSYNLNPNDAAYDPASGIEADHLEAKFQFSMKVPVARGLFLGHGDLSIGYTQQSFWQAYSGGYSSPFRETNHEPELMVSFPSRFSALGLRSRLFRVFLNHQSNGKGEPLSRSWNRIVFESILETGDTYISIRPWWRIPESAQTDDNPDIEKYLGNFELRVLQQRGDQSYGVMLRNNFRAENYGAVQLDWTFPLRNHLKGYIQYFGGHGESLIDYDHHSHRIGLGIMLVDWL